MTSIGKLLLIIDVLFDLYDKIEDKKFNLKEEQADILLNYSKEIRKDLERLKKLESEIQTRIETLNKRQEYLNNCLGSMECYIEYNFNSKKLELLLELKEVLDNDR